MDYYYPDRIADDDYDDELSSCCSAEIEGGVLAAVDPRTACVGVGAGGALYAASRGDHHEVPGEGSTNDNGEDGSEIGDCRVADFTFTEKESPPSVSSERERDGNGSESRGGDDVPDNASKRKAAHGSTEAAATDDQEEQKIINPMAALIQNERNRRLGIGAVAEDHGGIDKATPPPKTLSEAQPAATVSGGVFGNIRGWFSGGGGAASNINQSAAPPKGPPSTSARLSAPVANVGPFRPSSAATILHQNASLPVYDQRGNDHQPSKSQLVEKEGDDASSSDSSSDESSSDDDGDSSAHSSDGSHQKHDADLTPRERARARALRHLSNSCVDARRRAKTASYVRGLERLDLERRRDKHAKELKVVEAEMNKDRGLVGDGGERDAVSAAAARLARELPRIQGADAGAGSDRGKALGSEGSFMSYDEYSDVLSNDDSNFNPDAPKKPPSPWENKEAVDVYVTSLQSRLKEALERARSLEKRLVVLEQAGDDIVSSLCEDLAEVTGHSNRAEASYVKKGKELQRKRRREEGNLRSKIKQAERRVRILEEQLMSISGGSSKEYYEGSDSNEDSTNSGDEVDDGENDEVMLEKKLLSIKAKNELDKEHHESEVDSIRRQCEQLKLRLSVARLVMEGDDNLREYVALLERLNPITRSQHNNGTNSEYDDQGLSSIPPPPSRITRARAKLLKATHLERIYAQRLAVSKAFTDATINALEQELSEREQESQMTEVRCLNELVMLDSGIKETAREASNRMESLEEEAKALQDAIDGILAHKTEGEIHGMFGENDAANESPKSPVEGSDPNGDELSSNRLRNEDDIFARREGTGQISDNDSSQVENDIDVESEPTKPVAVDIIPGLIQSSSERSINEKGGNEELVDTGETGEFPVANQPSSERSINADDDFGKQVEMRSTSDESDIVDESDPLMSASVGAISLDNESFDVRSIHNEVNGESQVDAGLISDADPCQANHEISDECELFKPVTSKENSFHYESPGERSIGEEDDEEAWIESSLIPDAAPCQAEDGDDVTVECSWIESSLIPDAAPCQAEDGDDVTVESEPPHNAARGAISMENDVTSDRSIDEKDTIEEPLDSPGERSVGEEDDDEAWIEPSCIPDAAPCQAEDDDFLVESEPHHNATRGAISIENDVSSDRSIGEKDTIEEPLDSPGERSIGEEDNEEGWIESSPIPDAAPFQSEDDDFLVESEPHHNATRGEISMENDVSSDRSFDEKDTTEELMELGPISDAAPCQADDDAAYESEWPNHATRGVKSIENDLSIEMSIEEKDNIENLEEAIDIAEDAAPCQAGNDIDNKSQQSRAETEEAILLVDTELSGECDEKIHAKSEVEEGPISDAEPLQMEDDAVGESSLPYDTLQYPGDSIENALLSLLAAANDEDNIDADDVEAPRVNTLPIIHYVEDLRSLDGTVENDNYSFSNNTNDHNLLLSHSDQLFNSGNDIERIELMNDTADPVEAFGNNNEDKNVSVPFPDDHEAANERKPQSACSTDQLCSDVATTPPSEPPLVVNDGKGRNHAADCDHIPKGCKDGKNETSSELSISINAAGAQKKEVVKMLGRELKCTLAEYQMNFDLSSSSDRIEHLEYMNNLVLKIAKTQGIEVERPNIDGPSGGTRRMESWSFRKSPRRSSDKERDKKKRSKKKKKRRRHGKERKEAKTNEPADLEHSLLW